MEQKDVERFAFLYLCGRRDKNILLGKEKIKFADFYRLTYITDFLGFSDFNVSMWNQFSHKFRKELSALNELIQEHDMGFDVEAYEDEIDQQDVWIQEFCNNAFNITIRKELKELVQRICKEKFNNE